MTAKNTEGMSAGDIYDQLSKRLNQSRAIVDCLGNLADDGGSLDDVSIGDASWAVKDLLKQALAYAGALLEIAKRQEGGAA